MRYGVPYQGSKNGIAKWVVDNLPQAENLYDVFGGGGAISHRASETHKFKNIYYNDKADIALLFERAIQGYYRDEKRWISREDFFALKEEDPYVKYCWSFGYKGTTYLYGKHLEEWKRALHYARVFHDFSVFESMGIHTDGTRKDITEHKGWYKQKYIKWYLTKQGWGNIEKLSRQIQITKEEIKAEEKKMRDYLLNALRLTGITQSEVNKRLDTQMSGHYFGCSQWDFPTKTEYEKMQSFMKGLDKPFEEVTEIITRKKLLESLQSLESLESLESLKRLERLESHQPLKTVHISKLDYREVKVKLNSVIYCDPPYEGATGYRKETFDHKAFYDWVDKQKELCIVSSYIINDDRFERVCMREKPTLMTTAKGGGHRNTVEEGLFILKRQKPLYEKMMAKSTMYQMNVFDILEGGRIC